MKLGTILFLCVCLAGCSSAAQQGPVTQVKHFTSSPIKHIIIIVQENRSFDNLFMNYPGADTQNWGLNHKNQHISLTPVPLYEQYDPDHSPSGFQREFQHGAMNGWDLEFGPGHKINVNYVLAYTQESDVDPYWQVAKAGTLADRMFQSNNGPSFPAHQFTIAGQAGYENNPGTGPWGCDSTHMVECFSYKTIGDLADAQKITWRSYANGSNKPASVGIWQAYDAISQIRYGPDWTSGDIDNYLHIYDALKNGTLAQINWVTPDGVNSDHAGSGQFGTKKTDTGPAYVASLVNAIGASQYAGDTAVFITWDDWGGWFDHVSPPQLYSDGLGFRVPLICLSPWTPINTVTHTRHEFGSLLHFTEETFNLGSLGTADVRADDLRDCFNFAQKPHGWPHISAAQPDFSSAAQQEPPDSDYSQP